MAADFGAELPTPRKDDGVQDYGASRMISCRAFT
jgi:hypothetical protein